MLLLLHFYIKVEAACAFFSFPFFSRAGLFLLPLYVRACACKRKKREGGRRREKTRSLSLRLMGVRVSFSHFLEGCFLAPLRRRRRPCTCCPSQSEKLGSSLGWAHVRLSILFLFPSAICALRDAAAAHLKKERSRRRHSIGAPTHADRRGRGRGKTMPSRKLCWSLTVRSAAESTPSSRRTG